MAYNIYTNLFYEQSTSKKPDCGAKKTTDKQTIKNWAEARNGIPAVLKSTECDEGSALRIQFPKANHRFKNFDKISWDNFFDQFEKNKLALVYQESKGSGESSTFYKLVNRQ